MWGFPKWDFPNKTTFDLVPAQRLLLIWIFDIVYIRTSLAVTAVTKKNINSPAVERGDVMGNKNMVECMYIIDESLR